MLNLLFYFVCVTIAGDEPSNHDRSMDSDGSDIEKAKENDDNQLDHINQEKHEYVIVNQHFCVYACLEAFKENSPCNISMCHSCYESKKGSQNNKMAKIAEKTN